MTDNPVLNMIEQIRKQTIKDLYDGKMNYDAAMTMLKRQASIAEKTGNHKIIGNIYNTLAIIDLEVGNFVGAHESYAQAIANYELAEDQSGIATALCGLGELHRETGNVDAAAQCYRRSREIALAINNNSLVIYNFCNEGQLWLEGGQLERAIELLEAGADLAQTVEAWTADIRNRVLPEILNALGKANALLSDYKRAWMCLSRSIELAREGGSYHQLAHAYQVMAFVGMREGYPSEKIAEFFHESAGYWQKIGAVADLGRMYIKEGDYWMVQQNPSEAMRAYSAARECFEQANLSQEAEEMRHRMTTLR